MAKISIYPEWIATIPSDAFYVIALNGKNYKVRQENISDSGDGSGDGSGVGTDITDFAYHIAEVPDGINKIFTLRYNYYPDSCKVFLNGLRQTRDENESNIYDYKELGDKQIEFTVAPEVDTLLVVDYKYIPDIDNTCAILIDEDDTGIVDEDDASILVEDCP